jgi:hypothetical protein
MLDKMQARLDHMPEAMTIRRQTVEHPFGTLKAWMGSTHFLTRTLEGQNRDEPAGAGLQYEANDQYLRRQPAYAGDRGLTARACRRELPLSRNNRIGNHVFTRPRSTVRIAGTTPRLHNLRCTPRGCCKPIRSCRRDGEKVTAATPRVSSDRAPADDGTQGEQRLPAGPIAGRVRRRSAAANCRAAASVLTARRCLCAA